MLKVEKKTGELFGRLFPAYSDSAFMKSVELFAKRFKTNRFSLKWFKNKVCLDAGCGGGRYSIALSLLGAKKVFGIDLGKMSIQNARKRASELNITNVKFSIGSIQKIPFNDHFFDAVILSGVLHHTNDPEKVMSEISRTLRPGGLLYMLVYATGGTRWPMVQILRPIAQQIGFEAMDKTLNDTGLPVNKRRTYLDDLFVPIIDFYTWKRLDDMLKRYGFTNIQRWSKGRFDHEENIDSYYNDLWGFERLFHAGYISRTSMSTSQRESFHIMQRICKSMIEYVSSIRLAVKSGRISAKKAMEMVIGQGHHRVIAYKCQ